MLAEEIKRRYDIGSGVTIYVNSHSIVAEWKPNEFSTNSAFIRRPPPKPGDTVKAVFSVNGEHYYLPQYALTGLDGFWLGVKTWDSKEEMDKGRQPDIWGDKAKAQFTPGEGPNAGKTYFRMVFPFNSYDIKAKPRSELSVEDELVKDYLAICQNIDKEDEKEFNASIKFTGWTLAQILKAIGPWVPVEEIPIIKLEKKGG